MDSFENKNALIQSIIEIEMDMFRTVTTYEKSQCQERLQTFRLMRWMSHSVLPAEILKAYLEDLRLALHSGRNMMTEKYARMDDQIPCLQHADEIDAIVAIEETWFAQVRKEFPHSFSETQGGFRIYIKSELETYSPNTLRLLKNFVLQAQAEGRNLVRERYENLFKRLGHTSLADFDSQSKQTAAE